MNTIKKTILLSFSILTTAFAANSQPLSSYLGTAWQTQTYSEVKGNPYCTETWTKGDVALKNGTVYKGMLVMYDQVADRLLFESEKGDTLAFVLPVHEFEMPVTEKGKTIDHNYRNGFPAVNSNTVETFYEVINDDKVKLLKRTKKTVLSHKDYGSANQVSEINANITYYILKNDVMAAIKPNSKSVLDALSDKSAEIEKHIKENNLDVKRDDDLNKIFTYYNSL
ncbi:hypothetical protein [Mucilaginibacter jinjuensis]|uniref:WG repeat protein n=1 Tax=Mucilaginibacter jinjuensis TaxID=1176721 RepID=A0ABY7T7H2_9SPHI|nr:hypothetical protein [Mucilaginibacter jinjuensis]WCT12435.1 hypothetical protein PQO05_00630 [Mucilaginibacter jinjuensis]